MSWESEGKAESAEIVVWDESKARFTLLLVSCILGLHLSFWGVEAHSVAQQ